MLTRENDTLDSLLCKHGYAFLIKNVKEHGGLLIDGFRKGCPGEIGLREYCGEGYQCHECWKKAIDRYTRSKQLKFLRL